jgi:Uma2 family endonuclease
MARAGILRGAERVELLEGLLVVRDGEGLPAVSVLGSPPSDPPLPLYRLRVEQYHAMARAGILPSGAPVELLEGLLVAKMTKHTPHVFANQALRDLLPGLLPPGWFVQNQDPFTTTESEPEPDAVVCRGDRRRVLSTGRHPGPADTALVIEVSDSSLAVDRTVRHRLYARVAIPVYWIVNLVDRQIEVYTDPTGPGMDPPAYRQRQDYAADAEVPVVLDGREVGRLAVRDVLL